MHVECKNSRGNLRGSNPSTSQVWAKAGVGSAVPKPSENWWVPDVHIPGNSKGQMQGSYILSSGPTMSAGSKGQARALEQKLAERWNGIGRERGGK